MKKILITRRSTHDPFKISTRSVGPKNPTEENAELASTKKTLIDPVCQQKKWRDKFVMKSRKMTEPKEYLNPFSGSATF